MKQYVIIGGGVAGVSCIEGIRSRDPAGRITLISEEPVSNYGRPLISYYLEGKTDLSRMSYRGQDFYERNRVNALHGIRAERLLPEKRQVLLSDGSALLYDELCLCTGSVPFVPPMKGLERVGKKFSFLTLSDAQALKQAVMPESRVLILGGGLIGLKAAEGLHGRAKEITVCDLAPHVLSSILQTDSAALVEAHLEQNGIALRLGKTVEEFTEHTARLTGGETVEFDVLVLAVGVRPNTVLLREAGGAAERSIVTDPAMKTSLPHVYAAGDCTGPYLILPHAAMQGLCAGRNMAGGTERFLSDVPMNSIGFFGLHLMTAGSCPEGAEVYEEKGKNTMKRLFIKDDRLWGFLLLGNVERAGIYTALIREQRPLSSLDFEAVKKSPGLLPFGAQYRGQTLGGVV